jgi:hypothetical protein
MYRVRVENVNRCMNKCTLHASNVYERALWSVLSQVHRLTLSDMPTNECKFKCCLFVYRWRNLSIWHCLQCSLGLQIPSLHTRHPSTVFGHVCCIRNIPQNRLFPAEYRQPKLPSSYQFHHLVLRHLFQVVKNPPCSGFEPGTFRAKVRTLRTKANHYTIELQV